MLKLNENCFVGLLTYDGAGNKPEMMGDVRMTSLKKSICLSLLTKSRATDYIQIELFHENVNVGVTSEISRMVLIMQLKSKNQGGENNYFIISTTHSRFFESN